MSRHAKFIMQTEDSIMHAVISQCTISFRQPLPFATCSTCLNIQVVCPDLRWIHSHLKQETKPSKTLTTICNVKCYLNADIITRDGLLVVHQIDPLQQSKELIIVLSSELDGLVTALHICLDHQIVMTTKCHFSTLDLYQAINHVCYSSHMCMSLQKSPTKYIEQSFELSI